MGGGGEGLTRKARLLASLHRFHSRTRKTVGTGSSSSSRTVSGQALVKASLAPLRTLVFVVRPNPCLLFTPNTRTCLPLIPSASSSPLPARPSSPYLIVSCAASLAVSLRLPPSSAAARLSPSLSPSLAVALSVSIYFSYSFLYVSLHALSSVLAAPPPHWCACACPWGGRRGVPPRANRTHTTGAYISGQCSVCTRVWCSVRVCVCVCVCVVQCIILNCGGIR